MVERLGRYHLLKLLATGGMGEVFLARQEGPGGFTKTVVIKRILRHLAQDQGFIDGFVNEAQLAAQLQHPNIAQVFGLEHEGSTWFIAMEYVHGRSLREVIDAVAARPGGFVPMAVAARLASQVLQGLHFAHELTDARGQPLGILHRDVSPENLLVGFNGVVKLVDFGIARAMTGAVTRVGRPKGKLAYMAPELTVAGSVVDRRADLYGVGVVLYELIRGRLPSCVPASVEEMEGPRRPYWPDPALPPALNEVLRRALHPEPAARFATAQAMSEGLEGWLLADGQTALPSDIAAFLTQLWGREVVEANPAVIPLEAGASTDALRPVLAGTQPLVRASPPPPALGEAPDAISAVHAVARLDPVRRATPGVELPAPRAQEGDEPTERLPDRWVAAPRPRWPRALAGLAALLVAASVALVVGLRTREGVADVEVTDGDDAGVLVQWVPPAPPEPSPANAGAPPEVVYPTPFPEQPPPIRVRPALRKRSTGRVVLEAPPGLQVTYLGRALGVTPLSPVEVPVGTAVFVLRNPTTRTTKRAWVKVASGATVVLKVDGQVK